MGGGNSTPKRVTFEENENTGTVEVSEAVARRLLGKADIPGSEQKGQSRSQGRAYQDSDERDDEIDKLTNYYQTRIDRLQKQNEQLYQTTTEQFAKAVEEVESKFLKTTAAPVCEDLQREVLKCYQDNPKYTLLCSDQVKAFKDCVQKQRDSILTTARKGS